MRSFVSMALISCVIYSDWPCYTERANRIVVVAVVVVDVAVVGNATNYQRIT